MPPKVSIVTPSFNQGHFLEETILSVLNQDYPNLEYIIIDGGSTDNSAKIIRKYQDRIAYWVSEPDKGQSDAINKGFRLATGDILAWLNSDDVYLPGALSGVIDFFKKHPDIGCVIGDQDVIGPNGTYLCTVKNIPFNFRRTLYGGSMIPQPSTFFTRQAFDATGNLDTEIHYNMDYEFFLRMASKGVRFGILKQRISGFRLHTMSKTVSEYSNKVKKANDLIRKRYSKLRLGEKQLTPFLFILLKWIYKCETFAIRALTRGDFVPFRALYARKVKLNRDRVGR